MVKPGPADEKENCSGEEDQAFVKGLSEMQSQSPENEGQECEQRIKFCEISKGKQKSRGDKPFFVSPPQIKAVKKKDIQDH